MSYLDPVARYTAIARLVKELGAVTVLSLIALGLVYHVVWEVRPALLTVQQLEASVDSHVRSSDELLRLARIQCRATRIASREDPEACEARH